MPRTETRAVRISHFGQVGYANASKERSGRYRCGSNTAILTYLVWKRFVSSRGIQWWSIRRDIFVRTGFITFFVIFYVKYALFCLPHTSGEGPRELKLAVWIETLISCTMWAKKLAVAVHKSKICARPSIWSTFCEKSDFEDAEDPSQVTQRIRKVPKMKGPGTLYNFVR